MAEYEFTVPSLHTQPKTNVPSGARVTRVALYARVSTANGQQDPEMQLRELREHAALRGWTVTEEYVDHVTRVERI